MGIPVPDPGLQGALGVDGQCQSCASSQSHQLLLSILKQPNLKRVSGGWGLKGQGAGKVNMESFLLIGPGHLLVQAGSQRLMYKLGGGDPLQQGK